MEEFLLEVQVKRGDRPGVAIAFDLNTNTKPLTERRLEELLMFLRPSISRGLGDLGLIVNPGEEPMTTYTLDQIKSAFWENFHGCGELWFSYLGSPKRNEGCTQDSWEEFLEELEKTVDQSKGG